MSTIMNEGNHGISSPGFYIFSLPDCIGGALFFVDGDAEEATTMTSTGEGILISISISTLLIAFITSHTDWVKNSDNPSQSHHLDQVNLAVNDGLIPNH